MQQGIEIFIRMISKEEINQWVDAYSAYLLNEALYLTSNKEDAMDIVQDVFLSLCETTQPFRREAEPKTWLVSVLRNKVADHYRKQYRKPPEVSLSHFFDQKGSWKDNSVLEQWGSEQHVLDNPDFCATLDNCMEGLPQRWNTAVSLYYIRKKNTREVCDLLNITTNNFWKILQRCRLQLRECLEINWQDR